MERRLTVQSRLMYKWYHINNYCDDDNTVCTIAPALCAGAMVGVGAFSGSLRGSMWVLAKRC